MMCVCFLPVLGEAVWRCADLSSSPWRRHRAAACTTSCSPTQLPTTTASFASMQQSMYRYYTLFTLTKPRSPLIPNGSEVFLKRTDHMRCSLKEIWLSIVCRWRARFSFGELLLATGDGGGHGGGRGRGSANTSHISLAH